MISQLVQEFTDWLVIFATDLLIPLMAFAFLCGIGLRSLIYYTIKREEWFAKEFDRRVDTFLDERKRGGDESFFVVSKRILEKTYYELFEVRARLKRRQPDIVMHLSDRIFLIKQGTAWMVRDLMKHLKHLRYTKENRPKLLQISKNSFQRNPCFSKVFGIFPASMFNDLLNILPGMFIVGGIFGTFLGIMKALPDLGTMDLNDMEGTKLIMDQFLLKVAFSMRTSLVGILLSVASSLINTLFAPEKIFVDTVDRLESSLDKVWNISTNNDLPEDLPDFDEHRDPLEALAEQAVDLEFNRAKRRVGEDYKENGIQKTG